LDDEEAATAAAHERRSRSRRKPRDVNSGVARRPLWSGSIDARVRAAETTGLPTRATVRPPLDEMIGSDEQRERSAAAGSVPLSQGKREKCRR
jgi:hypothetical protein